MSQATEHSSTPFDVSAFKPESVRQWFHLWQFHVGRHALACEAEGEPGAEAASRESCRAMFAAADAVGTTPSRDASDLRRKLTVLRSYLDDDDSEYGRDRWLPLVEGMDRDLAGALEMLTTTPVAVLSMLAKEGQQRVADAKAAAEALEAIADSLPDNAPLGLADALGIAARALEAAGYYLERVAERLADAGGEGGDDDA